MHLNYSDNCLINRDHKLCVTSAIARRIFKSRVISGWVIIDNLPDLLQAYSFDYCIVALTTEGQLLFINDEHPRGIIIRIHSSVKIKYLHLWSLSKIIYSRLMIIDMDHNIYGYDIGDLIKKINRPNYIMSIKILGQNITSLTSRHTSCVLWLDGEDRVWWYNGFKVERFRIDCRPSILIDNFLISDNNDVYQFRANQGVYRNLEGTLQLIKLFHIDYDLIDIGTYPTERDISTIDADGIIRQYHMNGDLNCIYDNGTKRFINFGTDRILGTESIDMPDNFELINLDNYYQPDIKSG